MASTISALCLLCLFLFCFAVFIYVHRSIPHRTAPVPALFIFGDSTVDSGNNNHLLTISKANFLLNGRDFPGGKPTGRFCNGKLATDFLAHRLGLGDTVPAYSDREFRGRKLVTGGSFAPAASGYYKVTAELTDQLRLFQKYKARLGALVGKGKARQLISEGYFLLSAGTVDFTNLYYLDPLLQCKYNVTEFQNILLGNLQNIAPTIYGEGGRRLAVLSLPPFGCLPSQITLHNLFKGKCVEKMNDVAISMNTKMEALLSSLNRTLSGITISFINIYDTLLDMSQNPSKFGFEEARKGCCGTGLFDASILCNPIVPACKNASAHVYWDSYHPTSVAYKILLETSILAQIPLPL